MCCFNIFFFFNDTATTEIYTLSLHDALPISVPARKGAAEHPASRRRNGPASRLRQQRPTRRAVREPARRGALQRDRKSTRLNSSHANISYAVFCLKKKKRSTSATICSMI